MNSFQIYLTPSATIATPGVIASSRLLDITGLQPELAREGEVRTYSGGRKTAFWQQRRKFTITTHGYKFGADYDALLHVQNALNVARYVVLLIHQFAAIAGMGIAQGDQIVCVCDSYTVTHDYDNGVKFMEITLLEASTWTV